MSSLTSALANSVENATLQFKLKICSITDCVSGMPSLIAKQSGALSFNFSDHKGSFAIMSLR